MAGTGMTRRDDCGEGRRDRYLSAREAAAIAGWLTERQVLTLCHLRRLYARREGARWKIPRERFLAHMGIACTGEKSTAGNHMIKGA